MQQVSIQAYSSLLSAAFASFTDKANLLVALSLLLYGVVLLFEIEKRDLLLAPGMRQDTV